jgi:hypothetical protein
VAALVVGAATGAALGAESASPPEFGFSAESIVGAGLGGKRGMVQVERLRDALRLPAVQRAAEQTAAVAPGAGDRLRLRKARNLPILRVRATDESPDSARRLADAAVAHGLRFLAAFRARQASVLPVSDFEDGGRAWTSRASMFSVLPRHTAITEAQSKFNDSSLLSACRARGCGPSIAVVHAFQQGIPYIASVWARASVGSIPVSLVFGSDPEDFAVVRPRQITTRWHRISVRWRPAKDRPSGEVTLRTNTSSPARFYVDGVSLVDPTRGGVSGSGPPEPEIEVRSFAQRPPATVLSRATLVDVQETDPVTGALIGALVGVAVASCTILAGSAAAARRRRSGPVSR